MDMQLNANSYSPSSASESLRSLIGHLGTVDIRQALIARGYGYHFSIGAFSTPITGGGAGTILDLDQPEGVVSIPAGVAVMPVRFSVQVQHPLIDTDSDETEILVAADRANAWYGDGTYTTEEVYNLRTDIGGHRTGGPVVVASAFTADLTIDGTNDPTLHLELARAVDVAEIAGVAANAILYKLDLVYEPVNAPILVGPCSIYLYWGGTAATTGFAQGQIVAFPSGLIKTLV